MWELCKFYGYFQATGELGVLQQLQFCCPDVQKNSGIPVINGDAGFAGIPVSLGSGEIGALLP